MERSGFIASLRDVNLAPSGNGEDVIFSGDAVVFDSWSEELWTPLGAFRERILPGAFDEVLTHADVRLLANHDESSVMARTKAGTLDLTVDQNALHVWSRLDPTDPDVQRLQPKVRRKDIDQMSFMFEMDESRGAEERWYEDKKGEIRRDIIKVSDLFDVSPVTFAAYPDTSFAMRELREAIRRGRVSGQQSQRYKRTVQFISETPWAILPSTLALILEIVKQRADGNRLTDEEIRERLSNRRERSVANSGSVAVLGLYGPIVPRASLFTDVSGATAVQDFQASFREAMEDPAVSAILIDVDSPGGTVDLVPELAAEIRSSRGSKPIVAHANTMAASAAYWIASAADELVVTPSGEVGSIGVYAAHDDISGFQEKTGIKTTLISAGKYKVEHNPFGPLSEEAREEIQKTVNEYYGLFVSAVAKGRGASSEKVRNEFGQGRMKTARDALSAGMVDRIETFDQTLARLSRAGATRGTAGNEADLASAPDDPAVGEDRDASAEAETDPPVSGMAALKAESRLAVQEAKEGYLRSLKEITR